MALILLFLVITEPWLHAYSYFTICLKTLRQPGIEPGSIAWKATMLTFTPPTRMQEIGLKIIFIWESSQVDVPESLRRNAMAQEGKAEGKSSRTVQWVDRTCGSLLE